MKFLRILVIAVILNIPCAYAMQEASARSQFISATTKAIITTAGILTTVEGYCNAQFGKSLLLPLPTMSDNRSVDHAAKAVIGLVEVSVGLTALAYALK